MDAWGEGDFSGGARRRALTPEAFAAYTRKNSHVRELYEEGENGRSSKCTVMFGV